MKPKMIIAICILILFGIIASDSRLKIVYYNLKSTKISSNIRIALITDLHSCKYGEKQRELIKAIDTQNPDIILLGGDIFDDIIPHEQAIYLLEYIGGKYPCYYVTGNHEVWSGEIDEIKKIVMSYGIDILEGTSEIIHVNKSAIQVSGIDDSSLFKLKSKGLNEIDQLMTIQKNMDKNSYQLLLSHRPQEVKTYLSYGFDLMLSGHAHGGQWRIPYLLNGLLAPDQGFFPRNAGGIYKFNRASLIVSRGLARESTIVPRLFNRPELVIIDLSN